MLLACHIFNFQSILILHVKILSICRSRSHSLRRSRRPSAWRHRALLGAPTHVSSLAHGAKSSNGRYIVDCAFLAHPGGLVTPDEIVKIRLPLPLAIGDSNFISSMIPYIIHRDLGPKPEAKSVVVIYRDIKHGFTVRGKKMRKRSNSA